MTTLTDPPTATTEAPVTLASPPATTNLEGAPDVDMAHVIAVLAQRSAEVDRNGRWPVENFELLHEQGLLGYAVRRELGGLGLGATGDYGGLYRLLEDISRGCGSTGQCFGVHGSAISNLNLLGTPEQQERFSRMVIDEGKVFGYFGSEPTQRRTATGVEGWTMTAQKVSDGWRLNGSKFFATNSMGASMFMVLCRGIVGDEEHIVTPVVLADTPGVTVHDTWDNIGQRGTASGSVDFDDVFVPDEDMVGEFGAFERLTAIAASWQLAFAARYVGMARGGWDFMVDYLRHEAPAPAGLASICADPIVRVRAGELAVTMESAAALVARAIPLVAVLEAEPARARTANIAVAQAKVAATRACLEVGEQLFQLCGSRVTARRFDADRFWRNARTMTLHDPVDQRLVQIGTQLLEPPDLELDAPSAEVELTAHTAG